MRINDYDWQDLPPDLVEWLSDVTDLLNNGRYANRVATPPSASTPGNPGEIIIAQDGTTWYLYAYLNNTDKWQRSQFFPL